MFSNPGNSSVIGNVGALAAAIGAAVPQPADVASAALTTGSRLTDLGGFNLVGQGFYNASGSAPGGSRTPWLDMRNGLTYALNVETEFTGTAGGMVLLLEWASAPGTIGYTTIAYQTYEVNGATAGASQTRQTFIVDRSLGPYLQVSVATPTGAVSNAAIVTLTTSSSSRPCDRPRVFEHDLFGFDTSDGLLGVWTGTLAAGVSSSLNMAGLAVGKINFTFRVNGGGPGQLTYGWGGDRIRAVNLSKISDPVNDQIYEIFAANRPWSFNMKNTHATVSMGWTVNAWTTGD